MAGLEAGRARGLYHSRVPTEPRVAGFAAHRTCGIYHTGGLKAQSCGPQLPTLKTWPPHLSAACRLGKWFCMSANPWPSGRQPLPNGSACLLTQKKHDAVHAALHHVSVTWRGRWQKQRIPFKIECLKMGSLGGTRLRSLLYSGCRNPCTSLKW